MDEKLNGLEEIQTKRMYFEYDEPLIDIRVHLLRKLFYWILFVLLISIISGFFIVFPKTVITKVIVKSRKVDNIYTFDHKVYILERYKMTSDSTREGEPLCKITSLEIIELIENYNQLLNEAKLLKGSHDILLPVEDTILKSKIIKSRSQIENLKNTQNSLRAQWAEQSVLLNNIKTLAYVNYQRNLSLFNQKVISKSELENYSKQLAEAQNIYAKEKHAIDQNILLLENQINNNTSLILENEQLSNKTIIEDSFSIKKNGLAV